jgi:hypothetical protein
VLPLGTSQEEQMDTEEPGSACVAAHWAPGVPEEFAVAKGMVQDRVEDTAYFLVLTREKSELWIGWSMIRWLEQVRRKECSLELA